MRITPIDAWAYRKIASHGPQLVREDLEAWQLQKLNETLALVRSKSPFYQNHLAGCPETLHSLGVLCRLPFTTPENIRRNPLQFLCVPQGEIERVVTLESSGTTGEPKRIYFTSEDQESILEFFGVGMSTLTEPGERVLILLPGQTPGSLGDLLREALRRLGRVPLPYGPVYDPGHALSTLECQDADCLVGTPTQVLGLARRWDPLCRAPRTVLLTADTVPHSIVHELEDIWGCEVFNHYGATEMGLGAAVECEAHCGYHLREADLYFEIVDPESGEPVPEGTYGEVVFSTLTRKGMPLLRYRMGDRSRFLPGSCPCGTTLRRMERVSGRFGGHVRVGEEILKLEDFDEALFPVPDLLNFSVSVTEAGEETVLEIEARMLTQADATDAVRQALERIPSIRNIKYHLNCVYRPREAGSLRKRTIADQRREHALP